MTPHARSVALEALLRVDEAGGYSNLTLDRALRKANLPPRDAALATTLFYGVLEKRLALDYEIAAFSRTPPEKLDRKVREILRMAVYQLFFLEKIPAAAAVDEAVKLAKYSDAGKAAGFVNGVLRAALRGGSLREPDPQRDPAAWESVHYGCPAWLAARWRAGYGEETAQALLESLGQPPKVFLRVNPLRGSAEEFQKRLEEAGVAAETVPGVPGALCLEQAGAVAGLPGFAEGWFHVQDLSSQLCCQLLAPQPGETVADVCAAPGGKTFTLAGLMKNEGRILSFDRASGKVALLRQGARRLGFSCVEAAVRDARGPRGALPLADAVLCDAPCSGFGVIRRKPEIRYKDPESVRALPDLQAEILQAAAQLCRPGGRLFYSTCTLLPEENNAVADRFLRTNPEFSPLPLFLPEGFSRAVGEAENQCTLLPGRQGSDGFFIAAFRRGGAGKEGV